MITVCMRHQTRLGFTLVEVLVVVVILGLVGAVVVPQMLSSHGLVAQAATRTVVADVMYAQNEAIAQQSEVRIVFYPEQNRYELQDADGQVLTSAWKGGASENHVISFTQDERFAGVELVSATCGDDSAIIFDDLGSPDSGGVIELRYNDDRYEITVAAFTGRVTVKRVN